MRHEALKIALAGMLCLGCSASVDPGTTAGGFSTGGTTFGSGGVGVGSGGAFQSSGGLNNATGGIGVLTGGVTGTGGINVVTSGGAVGSGGVAITGGDSATGGAGGTGGTVTVASGDVQLPTLMGTCPQMTQQGTYQFGNSASVRMMPVDIYIDADAKNKPEPGGPLILYFHATGGQPSEVHNGFGDTAIAEVTAAGGVVASFTTTACTGCATTDDLVWFQEDDAVMDDVVACAVQQAKIDVTRIHVLGWSAGALHSTHVALARSNYIASFVSYSGGSYIVDSAIQNPSNHVAGILSYGATGVDQVLLDFHQQSVAWYDAYNPMGWYCMMCDHEQGHMIPSDLAPHAYKFFMDHPFNVSPEPYANGVPGEFPSYCKNMP